MLSVQIQPGHWFERLEVNAQRAIFHQWEQLEASGCIENFRIAAGEAHGFREGWFFADSDAYKWLEAAARLQPAHPDARLAELVDAFITLLGRAQAPDGYLFTYNQIHFPGVRWQNLQIEHELYCHGHLIEAGVSHFESSGRTDLLSIARRAADRIVADFRGKGPAYTPGHEEIEIALLRLHTLTPGDQAYLELARQFIEQRGRTPLYALSLLRQNVQVNRRTRIVQQKKQEYLAAHPDFKPFQLPPGNRAKKPPYSTPRYYASAMSGKLLQQHAPVRKQAVPVGHAVRFAYLETATAMLARLSGDRTLEPVLQRAWERMVTRRMYITGGIGSLPGLEGFGRDYELDPEYAYAETCAALASLFWNWEMAQLSEEAQYSDLFEWQLYNAAAPGMGLEGTTYLYNNPLACREGVIRRPWYAVPCCPSNLSRTWANLDQYIYSTTPGRLTVHQYISSRAHAEIPLPGGDGYVTVEIELASGFPWDGRTRIAVANITSTNSSRPVPLEICLRYPSWAGKSQVSVNGSLIDSYLPNAIEDREPAAAGYDPRAAVFRPIRRTWSAGDVLEISLEMPIQLRRAHPKVKGHQGKVAVTRGPLVYCLESLDNSPTDIFRARLDPNSLEPMYDPKLLGGTMRINATSIDGAPLTFIPYYLWGNRGSSQMTVWVNR